MRVILPCSLAVLGASLAAAFAPHSLLWRYRRTPRTPGVSSPFRRLLAATTESLSAEDDHYLKLAMECARFGAGRTYPNPAVGCVLVRHDVDGKAPQIIGQGFHPRAGFPHAEVFALLEAAGHVDDGVALARAVLDGRDPQQLARAEELTRQYAAEKGPQDLFAGCLLGDMGATPSITAYVTLEPCCHYGRTPPCAATLAVARPRRVVVGYRDPNPRVDGGGVQVLQEAGIAVALAEGPLREACAALVTNFRKRITPRPEIAGYAYVNGAMRSALRTLAARKKSDGSMAKIAWGGDRVDLESEDVIPEEAIDSLALSPDWMEHLDAVLWKQELVLLQLNKAVKKKKLVERLGERIATELQAHVAQRVGHTVLLYRPGIPPKLDLHALVKHDDS